jgi:hypothetical protein
MDPPRSERGERGWDIPLPCWIHAVAASESASITTMARESVATTPHACQEARLTLARVPHACLAPTKSTSAAADGPRRERGEGRKGCHRRAPWSIGRERHRCLDLGGRGEMMIHDEGGVQLGCGCD